jgi:hypothetical protein
VQSGFAAMTKETVFSPFHIGAVPACYKLTTGYSGDSGRSSDGFTESIRLLSMPRGRRLHRRGRGTMIV